MYSVWVGQKHQLVYEPSSLWLKKIKAGVCCCMCVYLTGDLLSGLIGVAGVCCCMCVKM